MPPKRAPAAPPPAATAVQTPRALARARSFAEGHGEDGQCGRGQHGGPDTLEGPGDDQGRLVRANPPNRLAPVNKARPTRKIRRRPNMSANWPPKQQQAPESQGIGRHHPLQVDLGEAQARLDRGQGHVDDGDVQHHHELGQADQRQDQPVGWVTAAFGAASSTPMMVRPSPDRMGNPTGLDVSGGKGGDRWSGWARCRRVAWPDDRRPDDRRPDDRRNTDGSHVNDVRASLHFLHT